MSAPLALLSAAGFGGGDFLGGVATRRSGSVVPVILLAHLVGLGVAVALAGFFPSKVSAPAIVGGAVGGAVGAVGFALLFRGLAVGRMAVVAPITAVGAAALPLVWGLATGERPGGVALVGAVVGVLAIPLIAGAGAPDAGRPTRAGLVEAAGAGVAFAVFFVVLDATPGDSGAVPLVAARLTTIPLFGALAVLTGRGVTVPRTALGATLGSGFLDMVANGLFLAATRQGFLALVAVLTSLYPAVTILLARVVLHERVGRIQAFGLGLAAVGVTLMAGG